MHYFCTIKNNLGQKMQGTFLGEIVLEIVCHNLTITTRLLADFPTLLGL